MTCREVLNLVEAIAAGDVTGNEAVSAHLASCPRCAGALAAARGIEAALARGPNPVPPARFTADVIARIRRERWRSEQQVDRIFNVAIAAAVLLVIGGIAALMNFGGLLAAVGNTWALLAVGTEEVVLAAAPRLATYVGAAGLLVSALAMWWWAERQVGW
jgi:anti-sigma factor RsiW